MLRAAGTVPDQQDSEEQQEQAGDRPVRVDGSDGEGNSSAEGEELVNDSGATGLPS
jgi:hypothetical protein